MNTPLTHQLPPVPTVGCKTIWEDSSHNNTTIPCRYFWASLDVCIGSIARTRGQVSPVCVADAGVRA